ncbi:bacillithiol biosynthesis deacetylase BshB1 [Belliella kenyensis]|uniref:Bacillithiol biosynthesis deacetylase BshB1 n=1 Tax=Belliella kenyensis TaxID=1472724 RepID=A0ABV8EKQ0_9BACT|nr:bacillithiol biosynthesis deacetylase BshB1 [Belliella kenyensis]MCH7400434.1 bacillithiol biosynthesis deacetylase BshB1 [Belliella kenyensis]MDN3604549.1 bacillithiol biosynthesis deacetylase BshB1 [Belliella kenyensis]
MKLDILVFAAHPDDAELACSGTIAASIAQGKKVGIVDFTQGELGTRGTPEIRLQEALESSRILNLSARENLGFKDILFMDDTHHQLEVVKMIRKYQPEIVLANAISDRHPDHAKGGEVVSKACFVSGLRKVETILEDQVQSPWRPKYVYHYIQNNYIQPDFVVDISEFWSSKIESIMAFKSQFYDPENKEPESFISSKHFLDFIEARAREFGHSINVAYGEGFTKERMIGISDLFDLK